MALTATISRCSGYRDEVSVVYRAVNDLIVFLAGSDECDELLCKSPSFLHLWMLFEAYA